METWGEALRALREGQGFSLQALSNRVRYHKSHLSNVESGARQPSPDLAGKCDEVLGTSPLLVMLLGIEEREDVNRRALLNAVALAAGAGNLGVTPLGHLVRQGFWDTASTGVNYDEIVARYARQFVVNASEEFGQSLIGQLLVLRQRVLDHPAADVLRATSRLAELYGLWRGNQLDFADAANWYSTAGMLAERSGDRHLEAYVRARTANRVLFEGASYEDVADGIDRALSITDNASPGRVEAYAAKVCLTTVTGDLDEARRAVGAMFREIDRLRDSVDVAHLHERAMMHRAYLACRSGDLAVAEQRCGEAFKSLSELPYWKAETGLYLSRAMVAAGDVKGGTERALEAVNEVPEPIGVIRVAVRDVVEAAPDNTRTDELHELRGLASRNPGPWQTLKAA